tara:strand:- start:935 stop:1600 length:666 start_codon:yes stop_codon:yes gene_type:complete
MSYEIIAVDGYASTGKSTLSKKIAKHLDYLYIDTGFMYRAITYYAIKEKVIIGDEINDLLLQELLLKSSFSISNKTGELLFNNKFLGIELRNISVSQKVAKISSIKKVRDHLLIQQRDLASNKNSIVDGRDIGTIVFPNASIKFFMIADPNVRAKRRYEELKLKNPKISFNKILQNILDRDYKDSNRSIAPLKKANNSIEIDSTNLTIDQVYTLMLAYCEK